MQRREIEELEMEKERNKLMKERIMRAIESEKAVLMDPIEHLSMKVMES